MVHVSSRHARLNPRQEFLLYGGGVLLTFGFMAFLMPNFLHLLGMQFFTQERMMLLLIGAALLAVEQNTDEKIQQWIVYTVGALGVVVGCMGLLVYGGFTQDVLHIVNVADRMGSLFYLAMGAWAIMAGFMMEKRI